MAVTMNQIAERLNISQATVSRVLNGKGADFISESTRERVLQAAREMGYHPNRMAQSLVTGKTMVVALWIRNPDAPYYARILRCVHETARKAGYVTILSGFRDHGNEHIPESTAEADASAWPVDGILAADCPRRVRAYLQSRGRHAVPIVGMSSDYVQDTDYVAFEPERGVREAASHLVSIGCRRLAHLTGACSIGSVRETRSAVFSQIVRDAGLEPEVLTAPDESRAAARACIAAQWKSGKRFDGLFCLNDDMAIGAYRGLIDAGARVPRDVALVGYDGIEDVEYLDPPLTTVIQPVDEMCEQAWSALHNRMNNPSAPPTHVLIQPRLIIRGSTARIP